MSKISNSRLILVLILLAGVIAVVKYIDSRKGERNFRKDLVSIDTTKVSSIYIYPKSKRGVEVKLFSENGEWKVKISDNKNQQVSKSRISNLFKTLTDIKPERLAARTNDKWKDFKVDTSGTRVKVNEGDKNTLDIVIGKMNFSGGRNVETYVRVQGDDETYAVNGYLDATFNTGVDDWRDKTLIRGDKNAWNKLSFALGDSVNYQLVKADSVWKIDGVAPTSGKKVTDYFNSISTLMGNAFADDVDPASLSTPQGSLEIDDSTGNKIKVEGFVVNGKKVLRSSMNGDNIISGDNIWDRIFADKMKFLQVDTLTSTK